MPGWAVAAGVARGLFLELVLIRVWVRVLGLGVLVLMVLLSVC